nr:hypothetical protein [uncultured Anaerocolumna sp.]
MKKSKKIRDERIEKASNKLSAYMYIYMLITLMVGAEPNERLQEKMIWQ